MSRKLHFITIPMLKCPIDYCNLGSKWHNLCAKGNVSVLMHNKYFSRLQLTFVNRSRFSDVSI